MAMMGLCHFTRVGCLHQETGYLRVEHPLHYYAQRGQRYVNVECRFDSSCINEICCLAKVVESGGVRFRPLASHYAVCQDYKERLCKYYKCFIRRYL